MSFLTSRSRSAPEGFGKPVRRKEDARLLTGNGRYSDDYNLLGQASTERPGAPADRDEHTPRRLRR